MITDRPPVIIIRIKDNPLSEKLAKETKESWERFGHTTELFDAITPDDFDRYDYLDFGDEVLPHKKEYETTTNVSLEKGGKSFDRVISDTAKAVYYSHIEVWNLISERRKPHIVVDHDMSLQFDIPDVKRFEFYQFGETPTHASYFTPSIVKRILSTLGRHGLVEEIKIGHGRFQNRLVNVDGFLYGVLLNIILYDRSLQDKVRLYVGTDMLEKLIHFDESNYSLYNTKDNLILDISKRLKRYCTVDHEKLKVN